MGDIGSYLMRIVAAAIICAIVTRLTGSRGTLSAVVRMIAGVFLTLSVAAPFLSLSLTGWEDLRLDLSVDASLAADAGYRQTKEAISKGIKQRCEAYILDKAKALNAELTVEVTLTDDDLPVPQSVRLKGEISPYAKTQLMQMIATDLGIEKEKQLWT